jgi:hypothetical protein
MLSASEVRAVAHAPRTPRSERRRAEKAETYFVWLTSQAVT